MRHDLHRYNALTWAHATGFSYYFVPLFRPLICRFTVSELSFAWFISATDCFFHVRIVIYIVHRFRPIHVLWMCDSRWWRVRLPHQVRPPHRWWLHRANKALRPLAVPTNKFGARACTWHFLWSALCYRWRKWYFRRGIHLGRPRVPRPFSWSKKLCFIFADW